jgi:hypothetical protein
LTILMRLVKKNKLHKKIHHNFDGFYFIVLDNLFHH